MTKRTLGEYRVGYDFNPSGHPGVRRIKRLAADLIDALDNLASADPNSPPETTRLYSRAMDLAEDAAMWGVKGVTKLPTRREDLRESTHFWTSVGPLDHYYDPAEREDRGSE